jgi:hypothetical protein
MIRTPDGDTYIEVLDQSNPDLVGFYVGPDDGSLPLGVAAASVYGFRQMTLAQYQQILADGRIEVLAEQNRRVLSLQLQPFWGNMCGSSQKVFLVILLGSKLCHLLGMHVKEIMG